MQREQTSIPKMLIYLLIIMLGYSFQSSIYGNWSFGGYHLDLMPSYVASAALIGGPVEGMITGLAVGVFYDLGFSGIDGLYPVYFLLFGLAAGAISKAALSRSYLSVVMINAVEMLLLGMIRYLGYLLPKKGASFTLVLQQLAGGLIIASIFCFISYVPMLFVSKRFEN